jgi:DNA-binding CsgD family transcriptional regulator
MAYRGPAGLHAAFMISVTRDGAKGDLHPSSLFMFLLTARAFWSVMKLRRHANRSAMHEHLIELIYESAFVPDAWSKVLEELSDIADARGGALYVPGPGGLRWRSSDRLLDFVSDYVDGKWSERSNRRARICGMKAKGFVGERELFSQDELDRAPIYREFLRPRGLGWAAAARLPTGRDKDIILGLERDYARGPLERATLDQLNELHPHLMQSAVIASRLGLERARLMSECLSLLGLPALVVDFKGRAIAANRLIEGLTSFVRWLATDRIALKDKRAAALLKQALERLSNCKTPAKSSFPARSEDADDRPVVVHVIPIHGEARDVFGESAAMVAISPLDAPEPPPASLIQSMFGLSPREARVAQGLAVGATLDELAAQGKVSRNTVRSQLRVVLEKTCCKRQAEVAALLSRLGPPAN